MSTSAAVGLVLARPPRLLGHEPFFGELIAGIEEILGAEDQSLLLHVVPDHAAEIAAYHRWTAGNMVDAVVVVNMIENDPRIAVLQELGMPAVVVGGPSTGMPFTNIWIDDAQGMRDAVAYLAGLGHRTLARVSGPHVLAHTRARSDAFSEECRSRSLEGTILEGDYTEEKGRHAARSLLGRPDAPTAIIFDNDIMALAALSVAGEMGVRVPEQLSLLAWDDSAMCRLANPALSAMVIDVHGMGQLVGTCVLNTLAGGPVRAHAAPLPRLTARGSTGSPILESSAPASANDPTPEVTP
ncbi:LacI family DNA-binding transcriptional regulator [Tessaracoccus antarcticus]|uniref:LacI family transcriptional regulator n=1 Tax=Tessaracoccus antarcticus TaxID=2479848 RepID=A0A3M0GC04_9ACTN|nr:substrate-binding domain-containing protein [Tessaracoccus antarcticus]RMB59053.1 LacI family transcriptional regulator [Tessaracoccus antarcticus]